VVLGQPGKKLQVLSVFLLKAFWENEFSFLLEATCLPLLMVSSFIFKASSAAFSHLSVTQLHFSYTYKNSCDCIGPVWTGKDSLPMTESTIMSVESYCH
jgi:hypothetical protein